MTKIHQGRWTAEIEGDFVQLLIGARVDKPWQSVRIVRDLRGRRGMNHMLEHLTEHPEQGLLGYETMGFANVQYWRSFEHLEAFARDQDDLHLAAWRTDCTRVGTDDRTGIWYETFLVRDGESEAIYGNMPARGLGKATQPVPLKESSNARGRLPSTAS